MYLPNIKSAKWLLRKLPKSFIKAVRWGFVVLTYKDVSGRTGSWIRCSGWKTVKKKLGFAWKAKLKYLTLNILEKIVFHLFNREVILAY